MVDKVTSQKNVVRTSPVEVSPVSTLPPGLDEGNYRVGGSDNENLLEETEELDMPEADEEGGYLLDTPTNVAIKSQTIRFLPGGTNVVDIVISFDDVKGAKEYEVRLATMG